MESERESEMGPKSPDETDMRVLTHVDIICGKKDNTVVFFCHILYLGC